MISFPPDIRSHSIRLNSIHSHPNGMKALSVHAKEGNITLGRLFVDNHR
jgi:hypothetical protein